MSAVDNYLRTKVPRTADGRIDFKPKRHHGFHFFVMVLGWLLPPLAVAVRFGIGKDFFINVICTVCGYIPGHGHNFFIQNIRNNKHKNRTPKWATRYGLVEDYNKKLIKKRAWTGRYDEGGVRKQYDDDGNVYTYSRDHEFEDGDGPARPKPPKNQSVDGVEERYYGENGSAPSGMTMDRRSSSSRSINGGDSYGAGGEGDGPGAGEAERRRAKKSSQFRGLLGSKKGKADRHARSEQVMGTSDNPYDDSLDNGFNGSRSNGHRDSFDDDGRPEDPDANIGKRYAANGSAKQRHQDSRPSKSSSIPIHQSPPAVDIMDQRHDF